MHQMFGLKFHKINTNGHKKILKILLHSDG